MMEGTTVPRDVSFWERRGRTCFRIFGTAMLVHAAVRETESRHHGHRGDSTSAGFPVDWPLQTHTHTHKGFSQGLITPPPTHPRFLYTSTLQKWNQTDVQLSSLTFVSPPAGCELPWQEVLYWPSIKDVPSNISDFISAYMTADLG